MEKKFEPGRIVITPAALDAVANAHISQFIKRHLSGDCGDMCEEDIVENALALENGYRVMSVYTLPDGIKVWIITEHNRSATTILLPDEY